MSSSFKSVRTFSKILFLSLGIITTSQAQTVQNNKSKALSVSTASSYQVVDVLVNQKHHLIVDFYAENIFRVFLDTTSTHPYNPMATPPAQILVDNSRTSVKPIKLQNSNNKTIVTTAKIELTIDNNTLAITAKNLATGKMAFNLNAINIFEKNKVSLQLTAEPNEYFFGGGVQNGRFTHKGKIISIENQNSWTDGGVASPTPFYWSTKGYAVMWHTFKPGRYDFAATEADKVKLFHNDSYLDVFFMVNDGAVPLLNDFYQLTGNPVLLPKFGFYQGHLNAYNRDYWKEDSTGKRGVAFEDGKKYLESQKDNGGIKESLNGEKNNYQFSARAVIDRYEKHDMPLGWILPNDGYGAGYGQTSTLDSNIANLKSFGDYARKKGVQIGLWTQSDLHPKEGISALLQRDIIKEVQDAGVRVLKTDVAWVGAGYSFGLNGVADVGKIIPQYGYNARPFIISLDGWAGTQRYATIWTGDQTGGQWEYIRFHIPTYLGSGLSGQPNITSDMDGIFGGKNTPVNVRDFQWKTFTPMQLNMDGWGSNEKYPHALGEPATSINRMYLKWKSSLLPYSYSIAKEAVNGLPIIRPMFLSDANAYTFSTATQYQFLYGPSFLVAPIYQNTKADTLGNDIRNNIYLPKGIWYDYFSGAKYEGGKVINSYAAPIWKLPVFVKAGAIIPTTVATNNVQELNKNVRAYEVYPAANSNFTEYDDDGLTEAYKNNEGATTLIESNVLGSTATITVHKTKGGFNGFQKNKQTIFYINATDKPKNVSAFVNGQKVKLLQATSEQGLHQNEGENKFYFHQKPNFKFNTTNKTIIYKEDIAKNAQIWIRLATTDITASDIKIVIDGFAFNAKDESKQNTGSLTALQATVTDKNRGPFSIKPTWQPLANADYYDVQFNGMLYSQIKDTAFVFDGLKPETNYSFMVRGVNKTNTTNWVTIQGTTTANPLQFAIKGITAKTSVKNQGGAGVNNLFDFDETNGWHTSWDLKAVPFDMVIDLNSVNQLDKLQYLPRENAGNGTLLKGKMYYSSNKLDWTLATDIDWKRNGQTKEFVFTNRPTARYIKLEITEAVGNFGSGRELYVYKVPGSESFTPGDINNDKLIDNNDLTSYMNYTGLRKGDGDFEGYISNGDLNKNGLIDAYDISAVATQLEGGAWEESKEKLAGKITLSTTKQNFAAGEIIEIKVTGNDLKIVNALSFALPYNANEYEFVKVEPLAAKGLENFTYDRLHTNRSKALYPTFINVGDKATLNGTQDLFIIKLKAKQAISFNLKAIDGILVDKNMNEILF